MENNIIHVDFKYRNLTVDQKIFKIIDKIMSAPLFPGEPTTEETLKKRDKVYKYEGPSPYGFWNCMSCRQDIPKGEIGYFTKSWDNHLIQCKNCVDSERLKPKQSILKRILG